MITKQRSFDLMNKELTEAIVDKLRSCQTSDEILAFESSFNSEADSGPLYLVICDLLRTRSISRGLAAKWLSLLFKDREQKLAKAS